MGTTRTAGTIRTAGTFGTAGTMGQLGQQGQLGKSGITRILAISFNECHKFYRPFDLRSLLPGPQAVLNAKRHMRKI